MTSQDGLSFLNARSCRTRAPRVEGLFNAALRVCDRLSIYARISRSDPLCQGWRSAAILAALRLPAGSQRYGKSGERRALCQVSRATQNTARAALELSVSGQNDNLVAANFLNRPIPVKLILASNPPRRRELLRNAESILKSSPAASKRARLQSTNFPSNTRIAWRGTRRCVLRPEFEAGRIVLAADTIVVSGELILGKPSGPLDATRMLRLLSGQTHRVVTAICLVKAPNDVLALDHESTLVTFANSAKTKSELTFKAASPRQGGCLCDPGLGVEVHRPHLGLLFQRRRAARRTALRHPTKERPLTLLAEGVP